MSKPKRLFGESTMVFRLRCLLWILETEGAMNLNGLIYQLERKFKLETSSVTLTRDLKILEKRAQITPKKDGDDHRKKLWQVA